MVKIHVWLRTAILIGIALFLLVLIAGGIYALAAKVNWAGLRSFLSAISLSDERLTVSASPATAESDGVIEISWRHEKKSGEGIYEFIYPCRLDASLTLESKAALPCNASYPLADITKLKVIPRLIGAETANLPLTVTFTPKNAAQVSLSGVAVITVKRPKENPSLLNTATTTDRAGLNSGNSGTQPGEKTINVYPAATSSEPIIAPNPNGYPDLAIEVIETGYLSGDIFTKSSAPVAPNQRAAIVFEIKNIGTDTSPAWNFRANLPVPGGDFTSETETPLKPGEKIRFTIGFDNLRDLGRNTAKILVDPDGRIFRDPNRLNNEAIVAVYRNP